jgi:CHAP domain
MLSLSLTALAIAQSQLGVHEQGGNNVGPEVNAYLASVGLDPGFSWCQAFMFWCFREASKRLGLVNPVPRTGSTQRLWALSEPITRDSNPKPGYVYVLQHSPTAGHVGIIESVAADGTIVEISGNTNQTGSRDGNSVWQHTGQPEVTHGGVLLGYLGFDAAAQAPAGYGPLLT